MASSSSPALLASRHITSHLSPAPRNPTTAVKIRSWRRFAAARSEAALVTALRSPPRRRNALRDKASPQLAERQVCPRFASSSPESHREKIKNRSFFGGGANLGSRSSLDRLKSISASLDAQAPSYVDQDSEIFCGLGAAQSGNFVKEMNLEGRSDVVRVADEESSFCGTGTGPVFTVHEDPKGNVVHVEVNEDEIVRSDTAEGSGRGDLVDMMSRARAIARDVESGERKVPKGSSLFKFLAVDSKELLAVGTEFSTAERNGLRLGGIAWGGFAALCATCIVFAASMLFWRNDKKQVSRNEFDVHSPGMKYGELGKGGVEVLKNISGDLSKRPQLDRHRLMNNIRRAKQSREWFVLRNVFGCNVVTNYYDVFLINVRRIMADVHTLKEGILEPWNAEKKDHVVFLHPVATIEQEVSTSYGRHSVSLHDDLDSSELLDISLSDDIIEENVDQSVGLENRTPVMDIGVIDQNNIGEMELAKTTRSNDEGTTDAKDITCMIHAAEEEIHIGSADHHNMVLNSISTPPSEFTSKEQFSDRGVKNLDCIHGIKSSVLFGGEEEMISANDNAHQISGNIVKETADLESGCFNVIPSKSKNNKIPLGISGNGFNYIQGIEAHSTFANDAQTVNCEEFAHSINPTMADNLTTKSPQTIREGLVDLINDDMQLVQQIEPSNCTGDDDQIIDANEKDHKIRVIHNELQTTLEIDNTETIDNATASTSSLQVPQANTIQHKSAKSSRIEQREKTILSNKEVGGYLITKKGKLQKDVCSDKEAKRKQTMQGVPDVSTEVGPSNGVWKTKRVAQKRIKEVLPCDQATTQTVPAKEVQSSSMIDTKNSSQNVKKTRRKKLKNVFHNQGAVGAQTREEIVETTVVANSPADAYGPRAENMKLLDEPDYSAEIQSPKLTDTRREPQPNWSSIGVMEKEESKLKFQTLESVQAASIETKSNMHGDEVIHEGTTDADKSKLGTTTARKLTKRKRKSLCASGKLQVK